MYGTLLCCSACFFLLALLSLSRFFERLFPGHIVFQVEKLREIVSQCCINVQDGHETLTRRSPLSKQSVETMPRKTEESQRKQNLPGANRLILGKCHFIIDSLVRIYGNYIQDTTLAGAAGEDNRWILVMVGGAVGQMKVLHFSLSEYLILYATPTSTCGHSGRYFMDVHDFYFHGKSMSYSPGEIKAHEYNPGDHSALPRGSVVVYRTDDCTFMLEYGRGFPGVFLASFYPFLSTFFCTFDFASLAKQVLYCLVMVINNLISNGKI